jgi:hypothetical protein
MHPHQARTGNHTKRTKRKPEAAAAPEAPEAAAAPEDVVEVIVIDGTAPKANLRRKTSTRSTGAERPERPERPESAESLAAESLAAELCRVKTGVSPETLALHVLRLVCDESESAETLTIAGLVAQCETGGVARAVVALRQFWTGDTRFARPPDPLFIEALLAAILKITGIDVGASAPMELAMREHKERAREFAATVRGPRADPSQLTQLFAAVSYVHGIGGLCPLPSVGASGGLIESKEDLATAYNTGWVDRAMDRMFCNRVISHKSAESLISAIQAYLGLPGSDD